MNICKYIVNQITRPVYWTKYCIFLFFSMQRFEKLGVKCWVPNTQEYRVLNHWVAPRSAQSFILPRSIKWVPGISWNLVLSSKLPPQSGSSLETAEPHTWKWVIKFFCYYFILFFSTCCFLTPPLSFGLLLRGQAQRSVNRCCFIDI